MRGARRWVCWRKGKGRGKGRVMGWAGDPGDGRGGPGGGLDLGK